MFLLLELIGSLLTLKLKCFTETKGLQHGFVFGFWFSSEQEMLYCLLVGALIWAVRAWSSAPYSAYSREIMDKKLCCESGTSACQTSISYISSPIFTLFPIETVRSSSETRHFDTVLTVPHLESFDFVPMLNENKF